MKKLRKVIYQVPVYEERYRGIPVGLPSDFVERNGYFHDFVKDGDYALVETEEGHIRQILVSFIQFCDWKD